MFAINQKGQMELAAGMVAAAITIGIISVVGIKIFADVNSATLQTVYTNSAAGWTNTIAVNPLLDSVWPTVFAALAIMGILGFIIAVIKFK